MMKCVVLNTIRYIMGFMKLLMILCFFVHKVVGCRIQYLKTTAAPNMIAVEFGHISKLLW